MSKKEKKTNRAKSVVLNIILWLFIIFAATITIVSLSTREKGVSNIFGYIPFSIQTKSMEPAIKTGDLIITKKVAPEDLKKGDVISFFAKEQKKVIIKTHRIEEVKDDGIKYSYVTKGDNNGLVDEEEVLVKDIISKYDGTRIPVLGHVLDFLKSQVGFFLFIILPLFVFFIYHLYKFIVVAIEMQHEKLSK